MPSIGAHLGVPGCTEDAFRLPQSTRYVVVLIDGLGWNLLRRAVRRGALPRFASSEVRSRSRQRCRVRR